MQTIDCALSAGTTPRADVWTRQYWPVLLLVLVTLFLYAPVLGHLVRQWYADPNYSHGFFVPVFCGYLIWRKRHEIAALDLRPSSTGVLLVLGSVGLLFLGSLGSELFLQRISVVGVTAGLVVYFTGWMRLRSMAFAILFSLFMIPLPAVIYNQLVFPLQLMASRLATGCLKDINLFPVLREGNLLILPNYTLEVVDACSGIRFLTSLVALSLAYCYLAERRLGIRIFLVLAMVPVAIVSNGVRVVITALLVNYVGTGTAEEFAHFFSGIAIFLVSMLLLLLLHGLITAVYRRYGVAKTT